MGLSHDDVREILRIIDESGVGELRLETERFSLHVLRGDAAEGATSEPALTPRAGSEAAPPSAPAASGPGQGAPDTTPRAPADAARATGASALADDGLVTIDSPMLGTFYRAESPGTEAFVEVGARVEPETIVCIIEVMKMMNSVPAGVSGTVAEVCGTNGKLVEYGEPLFRVQSR